MNKKEAVKKKYDELTNKGKLPLAFKNIKIEDPENNHELASHHHFQSSKFNNKFLNIKYVERALIT